MTLDVEEVRKAWQRFEWDQEDQSVADVIEAFLDGRLVDRENIDYEAAAKWAHNEMGKRSGVGLSWEVAYESEQADYLNIAHHMISAALGLEDVEK